MANFTLVQDYKFLEVKQAVRADLAEFSSDVAVKMVMNVSRPIIKEHYANAIKQVALKLRGNGMPASVQDSGIKSITIGKADGGTTTFKTKRWQALGDRYRRKEIKSTKFWHKQDILSPAFDSVAEKDYEVLLLEDKSTRNHHKNRINTTFIISLEALPFPFERGVTLPFLRGIPADTMRDDSETIDRDGLGRARFAEQARRGKGRPFLRKMSAYLGIQMRSAITKKLRKL